MTLHRNALVATAVLAVFGAYSLWIVGGHGYLGFLTVARDHAWGMQMLLDLVIACSFGVGWMVRDARAHGRKAAPFVVMTIFLGSIGLLAYSALRRDRA